MTKVTVVTHFSTPNWPIVNKLHAICKSHDVEMIHCSAETKLVDTLKQSASPRILFFTDEGLLDRAQDMGLFDLNPHMEVALFITSPISNVAAKVTNHKNVKYLIGARQAEEHGRDLSILVNKFAQSGSAAILDLDKYLAYGTKIHRRKIANPDDKREALEAIEAYIESLGDPGYSHPYTEYARRSVELADELLLNAIFDANPRMSGVDRSKPYSLTADEQVQVAWGYDGEFFGIAVCDPFGRMTSETVLDYVSRNQSVEDILNSPSAGLGLKFILERAHQVVTNVRQSQVTEVIALAKFVNRMLEFENTKKSFYFFADADADADSEVDGGAKI